MTFDEAMKLCEHATARFNARRSYEWQVNLSFWDAIGALIYKGVCIPLCGWVAAWIFYTILWLREIWDANQTDKAVSAHFFSVAEAIAKGTDPASETKPSERHHTPWTAWLLGIGQDWASRFQILATGGLMLVAYFACLPNGSKWEYHPVGDALAALALIAVITFRCHLDLKPPKTV